MAERKHYSKLQPIPGFTRIPDRESTSPLRHGPVRMLKCNACGEEIPSLGVGYHKQGRPCTERAAEKRAKAERQKKQGVRLSDREVDDLVQVEFEEALADGEVWAEQAYASIEASAVAGVPVVVVDVYPMELERGDVLVKRDGHETKRYTILKVERHDEHSARLTVEEGQYPFLYVEHESLLTVERAA